jgi:glycosyltransferase involved in cell wall biosynthesis
MQLLYLCDADTGGIAEYAIHQVNALAKAGANVTFLCRPTLPTECLSGVKVRHELPFPSIRGYWVVRRIFSQITEQRTVARIAEKEVISGNYDAMLIACYAEYFSPFWAGIYRSIAKLLPIGTIAHDPVRDFILGPTWWHRNSVRQGYSFIRDVFVHDNTPVDFGGPKPEGVRVHKIPHGSFEISPIRIGREASRTRLGFVNSDQVFLSFGQIRDGKNLDRFIRIMAELPVDVKLVVAGSVGGGSQKPVSYYQELAKKLGVADRCFWDIRYIPDEETGDLFALADYILMTYSARFRSASGVMNAAVSARKPILASSGAGPLQTIMRDYNLGVFVKPDDDDAIRDGARISLNQNTMETEWNRYEHENSWSENARIVLAALSTQ